MKTKNNTTDNNEAINIAENNEQAEVKITLSSQIVAMAQEGKGPGEIAKALGISYQHAYNTLKNKKQTFKVRDNANSKSQKIRELSAEGKSKGEISKELGISFQHVYNVLKKKVQVQAEA